MKDWVVRVDLAFIIFVAVGCLARFMVDKMEEQEVKFGSDDQGAEPVMDLRWSRRRVALTLMPMPRLRALCRLRLREAGRDVVVSGKIDRPNLVQMIIDLEQKAEKNR